MQSFQSIKHFRRVVRSSQLGAQPLAITLVFLKAILFTIGCANVTTTSGTGYSARISCPAATSHSVYEVPSIQAKAVPHVNHGRYKLSTAHRAGHAHKRLEGHVPRAVNESKLSRHLASDQVLNFSVGLALNNEEEFHQSVSNMYNRNHYEYHKFFHDRDLEDRYLPTQAQVEEATQLLSNAGFTLLGQVRQILNVKGTVGDIEKFFSTTINEYEHPDGRTFMAPAYELQIPQSTITGVFGLSNFAQASHHLKKRASEANPKFTNYIDAFYPSDIKRAYNIPTSITGAGQVVAVVALDGYNASDITDFEKCYACTSQNNSIPGSPPAGSPNVPLEIHPVPSSGSVLSSGPDADETTLDIEMIIAMAPGLSKIMIYETPGKDFNSVFTLYNQINSENSNTPLVISTSWGFPESQLPSAYLNAENQLFAIMASQGQTLIAASGDSGAYDDGLKLSVDDPASQPYVLGVGGTSLYVNSDGSYHSETSWLQWFSKNPISLYGGGGGISQVWQIPTWQIPVVTGVQGSQSACNMRQVPDVSLNSDPQTGYAIRFNSQWQIFGGTSAAAPLWAGFIALINQQRASAGLTALGFLSPTIYSLYASPSYTTLFHDISDGSNNGFYNTYIGYDNSTGLGSINGANLITELSQSKYATVLWP